MGVYKHLDNKIDNKKNEAKTLFGKEESVMLAGIAILLMIWDHLFNYPSWYSPGVGWHSILGAPGDLVTETLAKFGGICIQIFALISGYALFITTSYDSSKKRRNKLVKFLGAYWLVFALFLIVGVFNGETMPTTTELLYNMIGVNTYTDHIWVPFCWYVSFYIEFIVLCPLLLWAFRKGGWKSDCLVCAILLLAVFLILKFRYESPVYTFLSSIYPILSVAAGILCAKYHFFESLHKKILGRCNSLIIWLIMIGVIVIRAEIDKINQLGGLLNVDFLSPVEKVLLAVAFVACCLELIYRVKGKVVKNTLMMLGSLSLYLWFLHGIFFVGHNFMQQELYWFRDPALIFCVCIFCLLPVAYVIDKFYNYLFLKLSKVSRQICFIR